MFGPLNYAVTCVAPIPFWSTRSSSPIVLPNPAFHECMPWEVTVLGSLPPMGEIRIELPFPACGPAQSCRHLKTESTHGSLVCFSFNKISEMNKQHCKKDS